MATAVTARAPDITTPPSFWRRRRFTVALFAALLALVGGLAYLASGVDVGTGTPSGTVVSYLQALARGDAAGALAAGSAPQDRSLLTDEVLAQQQQLAPISRIQVLGTRTGDYGAVVHVSYRIGDQQVDDHLNVIHVDGDWRLASVAVDVEITGRAALPVITVFGKPVPTSRDLFVFPGALKLGAPGANLAVAPATAVITSPDIPALLTLGSSLTAAGQQNGSAAIVTALQGCAQSRSLAPAQCPQQAARPSGSVANSWRWAVTGVTGTAFSQDERSPRRFAVTATVSWSLSYQVFVKGKPATRSLTVRTPVAGALDYGQDPVMFTITR